MSKFKFVKVSKTKKLRYLSLNKSSKFFVVFLHGFMSDLEGEKPNKIMRYCNKKKIGFLALEYSGHGKSSGDFTKGNISNWTKDAKFIIKEVDDKIKPFEKVAREKNDELKEYKKGYDYSRNKSIRDILQRDTKDYSKRKNRSQKNKF